ncbi:MAG TPA: NAD-dependent epimerase/dehydratase family protein [Pseudomonas sp.]|nr:NAD-dependent epimerase/dehydratase family protein [Pseudomonas sp.]
MPDFPRLLIAGCGDLGCRAGLQLASQGWSVRGLRRQVAALPAGIAPLAADLSQPRCPAGWPERSPDYLLYAAAAERSDEAAYRAAYVDGLRHVLGWLAERGQRPKRLLFVSSTAVYGQHQGEWVDEASPCEPRGFTGRILLEAEQQALGSGIPASVVRLAGLYTGDSRWLVDQLRAGQMPPAQPPLYSNRIHRDDAAALLACLLRADARGETLESIYLGVDDEPAPLHEVAQWLQARFGIDTPPGAPMQRRAGSKRCRNARARSLGWAPRYANYREGYGQP